MTAGTVIGTDVDWPGDTLTAATSASDLTLSVMSVVDFDDEDGGWLVVGDSAPMQYVSADEDASTVTLAGPVDAVYEADTPVYLYDPEAPAAEKRTITHIASVQLHDEGGVVRAVITDERIITAGVDNLVGASVLLEPVDEDEDRWILGPVLGREPALDLTNADPTTAPPGLGSGAPQQTFSTDPHPELTDGFAEGHAWWLLDADGKALTVHRVSGGVWVEVELVSGEAAYFQNALIEALQVTGLVAVSMEGGSIFIAQGQSASEPEQFSGTALPPAWTSTKTGPSGTGSPGAAVPGVSVVSSGPTGQTGSALLLDFGPAGLNDSTAAAAGEVYTSIGQSANAEISTRFRSALVNDIVQAEGAYLAIRSQGGPAFSSTWDAITLELGATPDFMGNLALRVLVWTNGNASTLGSVPFVGDPTTGWIRAKFRVLAGQVSAKVWQDGTSEPASWATFQQSTLASSGQAALVWRQFPAGSNSRGQDFWLDEFNVTTYSTGFTVNPDASGSWPLAFQRGEVSSGTLVAGTPKDVVVNFSTPFGSAPKVVIDQVDVTNPLNSAVCPVSVTSSGFTARFVRSSGTAAITAHWSAGPAD